EVDILQRLADQRQVEDAGADLNLARAPAIGRTAAATTAGTTASCRRRASRSCVGGGRTAPRAARRRGRRLLLGGKMVDDGILEDKAANIGAALADLVGEIGLVEL